MHVTPKRAAAIACGVVTLISLSRICVLFLEALSAVRDERSQDLELLEICASGIARGSMKMRSACIQAQADRASPIVLKAVLRAVTTAFEDFSESVSSPGKLLIVVLFVVSSLFLPVTSYIRAIFPADAVQGSPHIVVMTHDSARTLGTPQIGLRKKIAGVLSMRRNHSPISARSCADLEEPDDCLLDMDGQSYHTKWE